MNRRLFWIGGLLCSGSALAQRAALPAAAHLVGAGATFPAPLYLAWADAYKALTGISVEYLALGSGAGVERITANEVDFAATDVPLSREAQATFGLVQFPMVIGGVVPVINIVGIRPGALRLDSHAVAGIYLGDIVKWNDPAIAALNPGLSLPATNITVVHRDDASGTSFLWTDYLAKNSSAWRNRVGVAPRPVWPVGVGGTGNEGVASMVQRTRMSIGYVEFAYARKHRLSHVSLQNRHGEFVQPSRNAFAAALASIPWTPASGFNEILADAPGSGAWPVAGASYILLRTSAQDATRSMAALAFLDWALASGQAWAEQLDYVALPPELVAQVRQTWRAQLKDASGQPIWPS